MKDILKNLYYGEISEWNKKTDKNTESYAKEGEAYEAMYATFSKEQSELFEEFYTRLTCCVSDEKANVYANGVRLGIWLGLELAEFEV